MMLESMASGADLLVHDCVPGLTEPAHKETAGSANCNLISRFTTVPVTKTTKTTICLEARCERSKRKICNELRANPAAVNRKDCCFLLFSGSAPGAPRSDDFASLLGRHTLRLARLLEPFGHQFWQVLHRQGAVVEHSFVV